MINLRNSSIFFFFLFLVVPKASTFQHFRLISPFLFRKRALSIEISPYLARFTPKVPETRRNMPPKCPKVPETTPKCPKLPPKCPFSPPKCPKLAETCPQSAPKCQAKIKALGGRFDKERRRWYVPAGLSLAPFRDYLRAPEPTYIELDMSTRPAQRAELKALGAGYDAQRKRWYVPAGRDVAPFRRWLT